MSRFTTWMFLAALALAVVSCVGPNAELYVPKKFEANIGGHFGPSYKVEIQNGVLIYAISPPEGKSESPIKAVVDVSPEQWRVFRKTLDRLQVWRWKTNYQEAVSGGTQWSLSIEYKDKQVHSDGANGYPAAAGDNRGATQPTTYFQKYLLAVQTLIGGKEFK